MFDSHESVEKCGLSLFGKQKSSWFVVNSNPIQETVDIGRPNLSNEIRLLQMQKF